MFALRPGTMLHEFSIEAVLGHGGFGITYRALDVELRKAVAIKEFLPNELAARDSDSIVRAKSHDDQKQFDDGVAAFLDEARLVARLQHKNLMEVLRFFRASGTGYIVLRYEQGRTLKQRLDDGPLPEDELRKVLGGLLDGIEVLHNEAILHRDIKPSNIILSDSRLPGERGVPVLIDFGAARDFRSRHSRSVTTIVAPGYAPPEQYGVGGQAGPWSDLYALGATAYRCVTGEAPPEALRRLRKDPCVPALEAAAGRYDASMLHLIDRMLAVEEADRPQSVAEVREALRSRGSLPRDARRAGAAAVDADTSLTKAPSRTRRVGGFIGALTAAAVIALGAVLWQDGMIPKLLGTADLKIVAAPAASNAAIPAAKTAEVPKLEAAPQAAEMPKAEPTAKVTELPKVEAPKEVVTAPVQATPPPVVKRSLVDAVAAGFEPVANTRHLSEVKFVRFSPDGRTLASVFADKTIRLWDIASGRALHTLTGHKERVTDVAFSPDGRTLASGSWDNTIKLWDVASGRALWALTGRSINEPFAFSPNGKILASGIDHHTIVLWDAASGRELRTMRSIGQSVVVLRYSVHSVAFSPDGRILASGSDDKTIKLWDVGSGRVLRTLRHGDGVLSPGEGVYFLEFSPDGRTLSSWLYKDKTTKLWDVTTGRELRTLTHHGGLNFLPDGRTLAWEAQGASIKLWDIASGRELRTLAGHSIAFSLDGRTLASWSSDGTINLWSVSDGSLLARYIGGESGSLSLDGKGLPIAVAGDENAIYHFVKDGKNVSVKEMRAMGYDLPAPGQSHNAQ